MSGRNRHHWSGFLSGNEPEKDEFIEKLESILSFRVSEDTHYRRALRHRSLVDGEDMHLSETYERLEFLGDAVLDLIATEIIFKSFPQKDEGFLTKLRARMVRGDTLAELAYGLGLNTVLEVGGHVRDKGIELSKSVLADIFESLVAAIYLSEGYKIAYSFVEKIYSDQIDLEMLSGTTDNYKSLLLEYTQANQLPLPRYKLVSEEGPGHDKTFHITVSVDGSIVGEGSGKSKKRAEQAAAKVACDDIQNIDTDNSRPN